MRILMRMYNECTNKRIKIHFIICIYMIIKIRIKIHLKISIDTRIKMCYHTNMKTHYNTHFNKGGYTMPRPKTGLPTKQRMNLTVSAEVRDYLNQLSQVRQQSVSEIISQYAEQEIKKLNRKQGKAKTAAPEQTTRAAKKTEQGDGK